MTFRIETDRGIEGTTIRLIGRLEAECLGELRQQIKDAGSHAVLDLADVELVAVEVVRFLNDCEAQGLTIRNFVPYIREWMVREGNKDS